MKIKASDLMQTLAVVAPVVPSRATIPALMVADNHPLSITIAEEGQGEGDLLECVA